jgi:pimeloyl-ACP methyl ester carboxylesterase
MRNVKTDALWIAYVENGPTNGWPVILSHGFPYDVHAFDEVASILARAGARVITPYTRGFGPTRFVSDAVMRSGQQAARGCDIVQLADALGLERPILGGFDWGGNASCVTAALWPERIGFLSLLCCRGRNHRSLVISATISSMIAWPRASLHSKW